MFYIDFIDTETGKLVFKEGKIIEAQNGIIEIIKLRFDHIPHNCIQVIKDIGELSVLESLRKKAITCKFIDEFIRYLFQSAPVKKWKKRSKTMKRGTDEAFYGLIKVGGTAVLKLIGINPREAVNYNFKSIVLKEKRLEPDIVGFPVLESHQQKVFIEFQAYEYPFIKYNLISKALITCAQDNDHGKVLTVIIYTEKKYMDVALSIKAFNSPADEILDNEIKELVLTDYSLDELLAIDPKLIVLAKFTVSTNISDSTLTSYGREWKKTVVSVFDADNCMDAINVMSLFILNRFKSITREGIKAMLDFDILDTVAGRQVYDEGLEKGIKKGLDKGLDNMREMLVLNLENRFGKISADTLNALSEIKDFDDLKVLFSKSFSYNNIDHFNKCLVTASI